MSYVIKKNYAHRSNYGEARGIATVKYCVWHYTGVDGDTDEANANYFKGANRQASAHRFIDDNSVTCSVKFTYIAWHCGHDPGGKYYHKDCRNYNSIGIELCDTEHNGKHDISAKTRKNAVIYGRKLAIRYGFKQSEQLRHWDVTHKKCPAYWAGAKNVGWDKFRADLYEGYFTGKKYTLTDDRQVRISAGSNKLLKRSELTAALQKCTTADCGGKAILKKGTTVTCKDVQYDGKGRIYIKLASGWICAKGDKGAYVKEKK